LTYTNKLNGGEKDEWVIRCTGWRNPIIPRVDTGYSIVIRDSGGQEISAAASFSLDATNFKPYAIDPNTITFATSA
jgi:hypothetical protein